MSSPLLEDVDLSGARGVLVNITASASFTMREYKDVMGCVRSVAADDATVIVGHVVDESMGDAMRVTIVATGLGKPRVIQQKPVLAYEQQRTGTHDAQGSMSVDYRELEMPAVMRTNRHREATVEAMKQSGVETLDIPSFLRKQAD